MGRVVSIFALALCASGCQSMQAQQSQRQAEVQHLLSSFVGQPISKFALSYGAPQTSFDMGSGERTFQWQSTVQSPMITTLLPNTGVLVSLPPQALVCRISLVAKTSKPNPTLNDWIVKNWVWNGPC